MKRVLQTLFDGQNLARTEAMRAMGLVLEGGVPSEQVAAFLGALRGKRETVEEIAGFAEALRARGVSVLSRRRDLVDTCGTGGDGAETFNISTTVAFVVAGAGLGVAKHGNRSVSSRCGSADVLETLGVPIDLEPEAGAGARELGLRVFIRAQLPPRDEERSYGASRDWCSDGVQYLGATRQSGERASAGRWCLRCATLDAFGRGAARLGRRRGARGVRRRRLG